MNENKYLDMTIYNKNYIFKDHGRKKKLGMMRMTGILKTSSAQCASRCILNNLKIMESC